jgi:hypothetical protein
MKITLELDTETAMELLIIHNSFVEIMEEKNGFKRNPILMSKAIRVTNEFFELVTKKLPPSEVDRIIEESNNEVELF